jgi:alkylation response protein AidB-like acyl-CoA dehydrogenase
MSRGVDLLEKARGLRSLVEAEADATDRELTMTRPLIDAFTQSGLFHLMVPEALGGAEADSDTIIDVFEELAHQDGSIGWTQMANASATSYSAFLDPDMAAQMVGHQPGSVFAGQFAPRGTIKRDVQGFVVSGEYSFGSGSRHASHIGGGGFVFGDDGQPEILPSGMPAYLCYFVPKDRVEMKDDWDVLGLRGTGSFDYCIPEQRIEPGSAFYLFESTIRTGGAFFGLGATALAGLGHAGWGLGVARRALDEIAKIAEGGRVRLGSMAIADQQTFHREFGEKSLALHSVRTLCHEVFGRVTTRLEAGETLTKIDNDEMMAATAYLTQICEGVTLWAYRLAGSQGLRNPSLIQRCFRDMMTGALHVYVDRRSYEEFAKGKLGIG